MLKEKFHDLSEPDDVDSHPATKDLDAKDKEMLKNFLLHIDYVTDKPSDSDKKTIVAAYYKRKKWGTMHF